MSLMITRREAVLVNTDQSKVIVRAHRKIHYPKGAKVPLIVDRENPSPFGIQVIGAIETQLSSINDVRAKEAGFRNARDFRRHWESQLYGPKGIDPSAPSRLKDDAHIVVYRYRRAEVVQKRLPRQLAQAAGR